MPIISGWRSLNYWALADKIESTVVQVQVVTKYHRSRLFC